MAEVSHVHGIAAAVGEIDRVRRVEQERRQEHERLRKAIRAVDIAMDGLERLNLTDRSRLPAGTENRIALALMAVPAELRPEMRSRESIQRLMDDLYRTQELLLAQKSGPEWQFLSDADGDSCLQLEPDQVHRPLNGADSKRD